MTVELIILLLIGFVIYSCVIYSTGVVAGRREGSRKAYGVGFDRGRRSVGCASRPRRAMSSSGDGDTRSVGEVGCLVVALIPALLTALAAAVRAGAP